MTPMETQPHRRWNPLTRRWVLVSPHRTQRPWQGQSDPPAVEEPVRYEPGCYLCPGNERAGGARNPAYEETFAFSNDFAALRPGDAPFAGDGDPLFTVQAERGMCRVLIYSPDHSLTLSRMTQSQARPVIRLWREQTAELSRVEWIHSILIFENRGAMMGASNPHPHGQLWANETLPDEVAIEKESQEEYWRDNGDTLLGRYIDRELEKNERVVSTNAHFAAIVPFWAVWPFETMIIPRRRYGSILEQTEEEDEALAEILRDMTARYDRVFEAPFPYTMGLHQRPVNGGALPGWHFHIHFYPPLLRSASVRKFLVGYEMLGMPQRDLTPEFAAKRLQEVRGIASARH